MLCTKDDVHSVTPSVSPHDEEWEPPTWAGGDQEGGAQQPVGHAELTAHRVRTVVLRRTASPPSVTSTSRHGAFMNALPQCCPTRPARALAPVPIGQVFDCKPVCRSTRTEINVYLGESGPEVTPQQPQQDLLLV